MTVFDAIRFGQSYDADICPETGRPHMSEVFEIFELESDGERREYEVLECVACGEESVGWRRV